MMLWHTAQRIHEGFDVDSGPTPTREEFAKKLSQFTDAMRVAGKKLDVTDSLTLNVAIQEAAKRGDFGQAGLQVDSFAMKYLSTKDRVDVLSDLVADARTRLGSMEASLEDSKKKGQEMADKAKAIADPSTLPDVI
jgi:hypothetical protein